MLQTQLTLCRRMSHQFSKVEKKKKKDPPGIMEAEVRAGMASQKLLSKTSMQSWTGVVFSVACSGFWSRR